MNWDHWVLELTQLSINIFLKEYYRNKILNVISHFSPGAIKIIEMSESEVLKNYGPAIKITPLRRVGNILDIAKGVAFLASNDASFITGANLVIDGGLVYNMGAFNSIL